MSKLELSLDDLRVASFEIPLPNGQTSHASAACPLETKPEALACPLETKMNQTGLASWSNEPERP